MKKAMALLLAALTLICFAGCTADPGTSTGSDMSVVPLPVPVPASLSTDANSSIENGKFIFSSQQVVDTLNTKLNDSEDFSFFVNNSFQKDGYHIDWTATRYDMQSLCYARAGGGDIEAVSLSLRNGKPNGTTASRFVQLFEAVFELCGGTDVKTAKSELKLSNFTKGETTQTVSNGLVVTFRWNDERMDFIFVPEAAEIDPQQLPLDIVKPEGFLQDTELLEEVRVLSNKYDYAGIVTLIESNVEIDQLSETDPVWILYDQALHIQELLQNCVVQLDDFDGGVKVYYRGVEQISSSINYVPFLDKNQARNIIGFRASNWLFFNALEIKVGETDKIAQSFASYDVTRNVLGGGGIEEWVNLSMSERDTARILGYETPVIRFRNKSEDKSIDHTMTTEEIKALRTISELQLLNMEFINQVFFWKSL